MGSICQQILTEMQLGWEDQRHFVCIILTLRLTCRTISVMPLQWFCVLPSYRQFLSKDVADAPTRKRMLKLALEDYHLEDQGLCVA